MDLRLAASLTGSPAAREFARRSRHRQFDLAMECNRHAHESAVESVRPVVFPESFDCLDLDSKLLSQIMPTPQEPSIRRVLV